MTAEHKLVTCRYLPYLGRDPGAQRQPGAFEGAEAAGGLRALLRGDPGPYQRDL